MLNIKDLEARHTKYKIKSYIPYIITLIVLIIILVASNEIFNSNLSKTSKNVSQKEIELNTTKKKVKILKVEIAKPITETIQQIENKKVILSPSMDFMRRVNTPVEIYTKNDKKINISKKVKVKQKKHIKEEIITQEVINIDLVKEKIEQDNKETLKIRKKSSLKIEINQDQKDIKHVIKRFKVNNNPALSLFVAKKYYQLGDYHKSYNYALITNQLNNNIEASWIIFSKSLVKLDKKEMAVKTLKRYIDSSHSPRAKILLDEIQSGKFK